MILEEANYDVQKKKCAPPHIFLAAVHVAVDDRRSEGGRGNGMVRAIEGCPKCPPHAPQHEPYQLTNLIRVR